jgi:hypothetical protein
VIPGAWKADNRAYSERNQVSTRRPHAESGSVATRAARPGPGHRRVRERRRGKGALRAGQPVRAEETHVGKPRIVPLVSRRSASSAVPGKRGSGGGPAGRSKCGISGGPNMASRGPIVGPAYDVRCSCCFSLQMRPVGVSASST